jgi:hypothetical protein
VRVLVRREQRPHATDDANGALEVLWRACGVHDQPTLAFIMTALVQSVLIQSGLPKRVRGVVELELTWTWLYSSRLVSSSASAWPATLRMASRNCQRLGFETRARGTAIAGQWSNTGVRESLWGTFAPPGSAARPHAAWSRTPPPPSPPAPPPTPAGCAGAACVAHARSGAAPAACVQDT